MSSRPFAVRVLAPASGLWPVARDDVFCLICLSYSENETRMTFIGAGLGSASATGAHGAKLHLGGIVWSMHILGIVRSIRLHSKSALSNGGFECAYKFLLLS